MKNVLLILIILFFAFSVKAEIKPEIKVEKEDLGIGFIAFKLRGRDLNIETPTILSRKNETVCVYEKPDVKSKKLGKINNTYSGKRKEKVYMVYGRFPLILLVYEKKGIWFKIKYGDKFGWINKIFDNDYITWKEYYIKNKSRNRLHSFETLTLHVKPNSLEYLNSYFSSSEYIYILDVIDDWMLVVIDENYPKKQTNCCLPVAPRGPVGWIKYIDNKGRPLVFPAH